MGSMFFAILAVGVQLDRNYIREKTLEGHQSAAAKGNYSGRPKVIDDDMLTFALALREKGIPVPEIVKKLTIKTGVNAGKSPLARLGLPRSGRSRHAGQDQLTRPVEAHQACTSWRTFHVEVSA